MEEGIHNAALSAQLAAPVITYSLAHGKVRSEDYQEAVDERIMSELRIARVLSRSLTHFPRLAFGVFDQSDAAWKAVCNLMLGDIDYAAINGRAGGFKGIFERLLGA